MNSFTTGDYSLISVTQETEHKVVKMFKKKEKTLPQVGNICIPAIFWYIVTSFLYTGYAKNLANLNSKNSSVPKQLCNFFFFFCYISILF